MSQASSEAGAKATALILHRIASAAILQSSENLTEGLAVGLSAAAPVVMLVAGMVSKPFYDSTDGARNPAAYATDDSVLFAALLISRSTMTTPEGCGLQLSPEGFADALADFATLRPLADIDAVIRPDMLTAARNTGITADNVIQLH
jgi:hypothetical protein